MAVLFASISLKILVCARARAGPADVSAGSRRRAGALTALAALAALAAALVMDKGAGASCVRVAAGESSLEQVGLGGFEEGGCR